MKTRIITLIIMLVITAGATAQVAINSSGANPATGAGLDVDFTNRGLLIPRVALTSTVSNSPIGAGLTTSVMVYNTATVSDVTPGYYYWNGTNWVRFLVGKEAWMITGNDNTIAPSVTLPTAVNNNFIGTTNAVDFAIATNGYERLRVKTDADGNSVRVGIGTIYATAYPTGLTSSLLHVFDGGSLATDFGQIQLGSAKATATNKVGEVSFHSSVSTTDRRTASIESYITAVTAGPNHAGDLRFLTNNSTTALLERMRIIAEGRVGIGTTTPAAYIDVHTPSTDGPYLAANFINNRNLSGNNGLQVSTASTAEATRIFSAYSAGTERISMRGNGRMMIGNTGTADNPNTLLDVVGGAAGATTTLMTLRSDFIADNTGTGLKFINSTSSSSVVGAEIIGLTLTSANGRSDLLFNVHGGGGAYGALLERMRLTGQGNLGIGTSTPAGRLDVQGGDAYIGPTYGPYALFGTLGSFDTRATNTLPEVYYRGVISEFKQNTANGLSDGGTYNSVLSVRYWGSSTDWSGGGVHQLGFTYNGNIWHRYSHTTGMWGAWKKLYDSGSGGLITCATANYVVKSNGTDGVCSQIFDNGTNVGINTASPAYKLDVYGSASAYPARVGSPDGYLRFGPANNGWCHFDTDRPRFYFSKSITVDEGNIGSYDENLSLQTAGTTRITILNANGNVGIGTTTPTYKLHVIGRFKSDGINETSDIRLKKNIQPIADALSKVLQMQGVTYEWNKEGMEEGIQLGLIAQEVEKILPDIVDTDNEGFKSIQYSVMVALLIEAIKEQQTGYNSLYNKVSVMEKEMAEIKALLNTRDKNQDTEKVQTVSK